MAVGIYDALCGQASTLGQQSRLLGQPTNPFDQLGGLAAQAQAHHARLNSIMGIGLREERVLISEPETLREELQLETDNWLKDTI